ncbi:MAG: nicotinamide riboside transporter PnuC [Clostridia bacterium]|nr:nicotinamide riboside transporter PnuC [Clostridia bacterium]
MLKRILKYFTKLEWTLWLTGIIIVTVGFAVTKDRSVLSFCSSLAGITCVMINAKGNVVGQFVSVLFSTLYAVYAYTQHLYGEMIIYFALMVPIHVISIFTWIRNRFDGKAHEVKINKLKALEYILMVIGSVAATFAFYFLLRALNTDNLIVSTISLITSLAAAYLMLRRCEYYSICFIANDAVLIVLWSMKIPSTGLSVLPSVLCFSVFLIIDGYSFLSWRKMRKRQAAATQTREQEAVSEPENAERFENDATKATEQNTEESSAD